VSYRPLLLAQQPGLTRSILSTSPEDQHPLHIHLLLLGQLTGFNGTEVCAMRKLIVSYENDEEHKWLKQDQRHQLFILHRFAQAMRIMAESYTDIEATIDLKHMRSSSGPTHGSVTAVVCSVAKTLTIAYCTYSLGRRHSGDGYSTMQTQSRSSSISLPHRDAGHLRSEPSGQHVDEYYCHRNSGLSTKDTGLRMFALSCSP
jgi:hypothetical protein